MLMEMAGSRSCEGIVFQDNGPDEQNVRGPNSLQYCIVSYNISKISNCRNTVLNFISYNAILRYFSKYHSIKCY